MQRSRHVFGQSRGRHVLRGDHTAFLVLTAVMLTGIYFVAALGAVAERFLASELRPCFARNAGSGFTDDSCAHAAAFSLMGGVLSSPPLGAPWW